MAAALRLKNAILHSVGDRGKEPVISARELEVDSDVSEEFITRHVKKLIDNPSAKEAVFNGDSRICALLTRLKNGEVSFRDAGIEIGRALAEIAAAHDDIPAGDVLVASVEVKKEPYVAIVKLNYQECFTHEAVSRANGVDNQLVKHLSVLPFGSGKIGEACMIPMNPTPYALRVIEEPFVVDGESKFYFSEMFLECRPGVSRREAANIILAAMTDTAESFYKGSVEFLARVKAALIEQAVENEGVISVEGAATVIGDENARSEFIASLKDAGITQDVFFGEKFARQQFGKQKVKAENGVEVSAPVELFDGSGAVEIGGGAESGTQIVLRHLGKLQ